MAKRSRRIDDLSLTDSFIRGITSEDIVEEALTQLKQSGKIANFVRSDDTRDWLGIDFTVYLRDDHDFERVPLQVKSSLRNMERHLRKHPDIPCVVVNRNDEASDVTARILIALNLEDPLIERFFVEFFLSLTYQTC